MRPAIADLCPHWATLCAAEGQVSVLLSSVINIRAKSFWMRNYTVDTGVEHCTGLVKFGSVYFSLNMLHTTLVLTCSERPPPHPTAQCAVQTINSNIVNIKHANYSHVNHLLVSLLKIFSGCMGVCVVDVYMAGGRKLCTVSIWWISKYSSLELL